MPRIDYRPNKPANPAPECFAQLGVDSSKVNTPFLLATTGELAFDISEVVLAETPDSADVMGCGELLADA